MTKVIKKFGVDFDSAGGALTICPSYIGKNDSGWAISGEICEDYYEWVNDFEATHFDLGWVRGNFEDTVEASSQEAYDHFYENHTPDVWDYRDI